MDKRIDEKRDLSDVLFRSGYGFDRGTCNDLARQILAYGYHRYNYLVERMTEGVDGWKKHYESLYETAKATIREEVAREIFAEIEKFTKTCPSKLYTLRGLKDFIAELKKKYEVKTE